jgi:lysyl-tRNA synthetase, class I
MYWADELAASVVDQGAQVVNDSKTPSGTVHVGSLRGVVLHDAIARALADAGVEAVYRYGVDDMDPMDNQALLSGDAVDRYMGAPLCRVPDPEGDCHVSYARHFAERFLEIFAGLGVEPDVYWMSDLYAEGSMDPWIRQALDRSMPKPA